MSDTTLIPTDADRSHDLRAALDVLDSSPYGMVSLTVPVVRAALVRAIYDGQRASYAEQRADELQRLLDEAREAQPQRIGVT